MPSALLQAARRCRIYIRCEPGGTSAWQAAPACADCAPAARRRSPQAASLGRAEPCPSLPPAGHTSGHTASVRAGQIVSSSGHRVAATHRWHCKPRAVHAASCHQPVTPTCRLSAWAMMLIAKPPLPLTLRQMLRAGRRGQRCAEHNPTLPLGEVSGPLRTLNPSGCAPRHWHALLPCTHSPLPAVAEHEWHGGVGRAPERDGPAPAGALELHGGRRGCYAVNWLGPAESHCPVCGRWAGKKDTVSSRPPGRRSVQSPGSHSGLQKRSIRTCRPGAAGRRPAKHRLPWLSAPGQQEPHTH